MGRWSYGKGWRWFIMFCFIVTFGMAFTLTGPTVDGSGETAVFAFDAVSGVWRPVAAGDERVGVSFAGKPLSGACNKESWPNQIKVRTEVHPFKEDFVKTAAPLTNNIQVLPDGSFQVPMFQPASWRLTIKVTNNHFQAMKDVRVIDNFGAEFGVEPAKPSHGNVEIALTGNSEKAHLVWVVGDLPAGETAQLYLTVTTDCNPAGRQEFTSPGKYELNPGATLFCRLNGVKREQSSGPLYVYAGDDSKGSSMVETGPIDEAVGFISVASLKVGSLGETAYAEPKESGGAPPIQFKEEFLPITPSISPKPAHGGFRDGFEVPEDTRVEWTLRLTVKNSLKATVTDLTVTENLGAELEIDRNSLKKVPSNSRFDYRRQGNIKMEWKITSLRPGEQAVLEVGVYSRVQNGHQQYAEPTPAATPNYLNSGATLKYSEPYVSGMVSVQCHRQRSVNLWPVPVWVGDKPVLKVVLSAAQYLWQIRKPGVYAAAPMELSVFSNRRVLVTFSDFADLAASESGLGALPVHYGVGNSLAEVEQSRWYTAAKWNQVKLTTQPTQVGTTVVWRIWPRIEVFGHTKAARYSNTGKLTVTVLETEPYVQGSGSDGMMGVKGFSGFDFTEW